MAKEKQFFLAFTPSGAADVVTYRMYYEKQSDPANPVFASYDSLYEDLGLPAADGDGVVRIDIRTIMESFHEPTLPAIQDGFYSIGIVEIDGIGNESDISLIPSIYEFDFNAPSGVIEVHIEN